jgi:hypothetical protein
MSFWDILSQDEAEFAKAIIAALTGVPWAVPLLADIAASGGLTLATWPLQPARLLTPASVVWG